MSINFQDRRLIPLVADYILMLINVYSKKACANGPTARMSSFHRLTRLNSHASFFYLRKVRPEYSVHYCSV